jgi:hypothetical protein
VGSNVRTSRHIPIRSHSPGRSRRQRLDRSQIDGNDLGPGDDGDFDDGAWHVACHLLGAGGARRLADGRIAWLEISHRPPDEYFASITVDDHNVPKTVPIKSAEGERLLAGSTLLGFVEGNSTGHISARGVHDSAARYNGWNRQDFDQPVNSNQDGGKVWEHWCTLRNIRTPDATTKTLLAAYVALVAALGDRFVPSVARGRRDYAHPRQLVAIVEAGLTSSASATWDTMPVPIPAAAEPMFLEATPSSCLKGISMLDWGQGNPKYFMFTRRIMHWSKAQQVRRDLGLP